MRMIEPINKKSKENGYGGIIRNRNEYDRV